MAHKRKQGVVLYGQLHNEKTRTVTPFTQEMQNVDRLGDQVDAIGDQAAEAIPQDASAVLVKTFDYAAEDAILIAQAPIAYDVQTSFRVPPILTSLAVVYNQTVGVGQDETTGEANFGGTSYSLSIGAAARSTGSGGVTPDLIVNIRQPWTYDIPARAYSLYMPLGFTLAQLLTELSAADAANATVHAWPVFNPEGLSISLHGQSASLSTNADVRESLSHSGSGDSRTRTVEQGQSIEGGLTIRTKEIDPTLHREITISNPSVTVTANSVAIAGWTGEGDMDDGAARSPLSGVLEKDVVGSVYPTVIPATTPTNIPTTGLYLREFSTQADAGKVSVVGIVINAALLQVAPQLLNYVNNPIVLVAGTPVVLSPSNVGGTIDSYALSSSLSGAGFSFNTTTGVISGTPTTFSPTSRTVTGTNTAGTASVTFTISAA